MEIANSADLDKWLFDHAQTQMHPCHGVKGDVPNEEGRVNVAWVDTVTGERFEMVWYDPDNLETWNGDADYPGDGDVPNFLHHPECPSFCEYCCNDQGFEQAEMIARTKARDEANKEVSGGRSTSAALTGYPNTDKETS